MATINIQTVGSGRTHTTLKAFGTWLAARDLVANNEIVEAHVYNNQAAADLSLANLGPLTYSEQCYCVVRPAPGLGVNELEPGTLDYGTQGIELTVVAGTNMRVNNGCCLTGFRIAVTAGGNASLIGVNVSTSSNARPNNVYDAAMRGCRVKAANSGASVNWPVYAGEFNCPAQVTDNLFIQEGANGSPVLNASGSAKTLRNTFISRGAGAGMSSMRTSNTTVTVRDNVFLNGGATPLTRFAEPATCSNNFSNTSITGSSTGFTVNTTPNALVENLASDYRPKAGSPLIGAASSSAVSQPDLLGNNRGTAPDVGAWQRTPAAAIPTGTITTQAVNGQTITLSGTTANTPTSGLATLSATSAGTTQGPTALTLGAGTFSVTWTNVPAGVYSAPTVTLTNGGGTTAALNGAAPVTILAVSGNPEGTLTPQTPVVLPTVAVTTAVVSGQGVTTTGTVNMQGDTGGTLAVYLDPVGQGITVGPFSVTPSGGNWTANLIAPTAGLWRVRAVVSANAAVVSASSATLTVVGLSGSLLLPL